MKNFDALLVGYYGMTNTGDDMLMAATAEGASDLYGAKSLAATCPAGSEVARWLNCTPVQGTRQWVKGQGRFEKYIGAARSKHILIGGGSVFHTAKDIAQKRHYLKLAGKGEHRAVGVGLGPFVDRAAEMQCAKFLNEVDFTGVRDDVSLEIAQAIAPKANVKKTFDLAPGMVHRDVFKQAIASSADNAIGVALCPRERLMRDQSLEAERMDKLAYSLRAWHEEFGSEIRLIDLNGNSELGDAQVHEDLRTRLDGLPVKHINYNANPYACVNEISKLKLLVAMRLHASVFAYLTKVPLLSVNYHRKCDNWCEDIGHNELNFFDAGGFSEEAMQKRGVEILQGNYIAPSLPVEEANRLSLTNWASL